MGIAPHRTNVFLRKPDGLARVREKHDVVLAIRDRGADQKIAWIEIHRNDSGGASVAKITERGLLDGSSSGRHKHIVLVIERFDRQHDRNLLAVHKGKTINDRASTGCARALRDLVDLHPVNPAAIREAQQRVMGVGDEELVDPVVLPGSGRLSPAAPTPLGAILRERLALDIATVRDRHHHIGRGDEVLNPEFSGVGLNGRAPGITKLAPDIVKLVGNDGSDALSPGENVQQIGNRENDLAVFRDNPILLQPREALQPHVQNLLGLSLRQPVAVRAEPQSRIHPFGAEST